MLLRKHGSWVLVPRQWAAICWLLAVVLVPIIGCVSPDRTEVTPPSVDPKVAATNALNLYDADKDGALSKQELEACPGLLSALPRYDANRDGQVDQEELINRLSALYTRGVGLMSINCTVRRGGTPVSGARVQFIPEEFLGDAIQVAHGVTDPGGNARMAIPDEKLPENQRGLQMMQAGVYRVEITTKPDQTDKTRQLPGFEADPTSRESRDPAFDIVSR